MTLSTIHLAFKTHLDLGFTDLAERVLQRYLDELIPGAIATAERMREGGIGAFTWTTGSYVIHEALERADHGERKRLEAAIEAGDLCWHALPFTLHTELADPSLIEHGLSITARLDERFGRTTRAAKMTDVPGHTLGIVPLLAAAGVEFLHLGVNPASTPPDVPPLFRWRAPDGSEVVVAYDHDGYGGLVRPPGDEALAVIHAGDNIGPPDEAMVLLAAARLEADHPGVTLEVGGLDGIVPALRRHRGDLPVVDLELGDTWIHGAGTDPAKVARLRELMRLRRHWLIERPDRATDEGLRRASTAMLCVVEHTWGMDHKIWLPEWTLWSRASLAGIRDEFMLQHFESSWAEQRAYLDTAVASLPSELRGEAETALAALEPTVPTVADAAPVDPATSFRLGAWELRLDPERAAIVAADQPAWGVSLADDAHRLAEYSYQAFDGSDYEAFSAAYNRVSPETIDWFVQDFTKPGIDADGARRDRRHARIDTVGVGTAPDGSPRALAHLVMAETPDDAYGAPPELWLAIDAVPAPAADGAPDAGPEGLRLHLVWMDKPATRLPEAGWFGFQPVVADPTAWRLDKLGFPVDPRAVVGRGGSRLHAVGDGAFHPGLRIETLDAPLVAVGHPTLLDPQPFLPDAPPVDPAGGLHLNLHNNVWGTNFPMWCEGAASFRVLLWPASG